MPIRSKTKHARYCEDANPFFSPEPVNFVLIYDCATEEDLKQSCVGQMIFRTEIEGYDTYDHAMRGLCEAIDGGQEIVKWSIIEVKSAVSFWHNLDHSHPPIKEDHVPYDRPLPPKDGQEIVLNIITLRKEIEDYQKDEKEFREWLDSLSDDDPKEKVDPNP